MNNNVKDFVSIKKLETTKDIAKLEEGRGYYIKKDDLLTVLFHNGEPMRFLGFIEFNNKKTRGDHYHKEKVENMCVISGKIKAKYLLPEKPQDIFEIELNEGDIVTIFPGCAHSYISDSNSTAIEFSPQLFNKEDTVDYKFE